MFFVWFFFTNFFGFALFCSILCAFVLIPRPGTNQWICCIKYYLNYQRYTWLTTNTLICSFFQAKLSSVHKDMLDILLCRVPLRLFGLVLFSWFVTWILRAGLVGWTLTLFLFICLTWSTGTGSCQVNHALPAVTLKWTVSLIRLHLATDGGPTMNNGKKKKKKYFCNSWLSLCWQQSTKWHGVCWRHSPSLHCTGSRSSLQVTVMSLKVQTRRFAPFPHWVPKTQRHLWQLLYLEVNKDRRVLYVFFIYIYNTDEVGEFVLFRS